ncbi:MarR family winged helix-turn-helix transcriptional regulator [Bifidobacterium sp. ESL0800]|uniref:MarR family winged helix-turn-helix transcriptional regulator n=1 Tax=Bifidobacterium sp. ESL0800 TaxID=2983236 RepID=UPI0023FA1C9E|nr:MarR family winged helix-turn-helix transcriptional regulator [Bifidobacterium sp. ESL0800]WEV75256.1 MarR family winged helix-turn-helix transcriptional regulator [Bifidobacterium sp. ESL0800]
MTDTPDGRPENYGRLLQQASSSMGQELGRFAARYGLTEVQMAVINFMSSQPGGQVAQHAIEEEFHIQRSTVTVTLQRMEARGLLTREQAPDDARRKTVRLTARATRDVEAIHNYIDHEQREFERRFSPTQITDFKAALAFFAHQQNDDNEIESAPPR